MRTRIERLGVSVRPAGRSGHGGTRRADGDVVVDAARLAWPGAADRSSKTALDALTVSYAQALARDGFKVNGLAPGVRGTNLNPQTANAAFLLGRDSRAVVNAYDR